MRKSSGANSDAPTPPKAPETEPTTVLATTPEPAKLTNSDIKALTGDDGSESFENAANKDAAEAMKEDRAAAKSKDGVEKPYFHGQGGAAGL
jgi:hypothetical protein